ncbi:MAG: transcription-repair coupling factor [Bacillota bacterium]
MSRLLDALYSDNQVKAIVECLSRGARIAVTGVLPSVRGVLAGGLARWLGKRVLVLAPDPDRALEIYLDAMALASCECYRFTAWDVPTEQVLARSPEEVAEALRALNVLAAGRETPAVVVCSLASALKLLPTPSSMGRCTMEVSAGTEVDPQHMARALVDAGYKRVEVVEKLGQFAARGGIIDLFSPGLELPVRIEVEFDRVESLRTFDPDTQRSVEQIELLRVLPAPEWLYSEASCTVLDWFAPTGVLLVDDPNRLVEEARKIEATRITEKLLDHCCTAHLMALPRALPEGLGAPVDQLVSLGARPSPVYMGRWSQFLDEARTRKEEGWHTLLLVPREETLERVRRGLANAELTLSVEQADLSAGFELPSSRLCVLTERELFGKEKRARVPAKRQRKAELALSELKPGDYVVHVHHGIGQYLGMRTLEIDKTLRDYLFIRYADGDALYVPSDQMDLIEKYIGAEGVEPKLNKLGGGEWNRQKKKVKESVKQMAKELLELYTARMSIKGYAFSPDTPWQREFEEAFRYEDTPDQKQATREIKEDMEAPRPMDRLLCGDVGYGKTEVAMRAAMKAVQDSKQVAVLVPTTILAQQHFNTFTDRFKGYPVRIEVLSRFRGQEEQDRIIKELRQGLIDIVIGTHRLLSKDVQFHDLGLLIVDEEHRFGVRHKERIKQLKKEVDVLTLTATPIPRTLYMALSGLRDVSMIETPPEGRLPVQTFVVEYDEELIKNAIRRELARGGQVYYVHNRIESIARCAGKVMNLVPEARVAVAHGRTREQELARIMEAFAQREYDVLVTTMIIESGLDIPNVNTLIVEDADRLGLAQLYQIRGRVGRSNRVAYAYFTFSRGKVLTPQAESRLEAIREFTELGSGYRIAMRDLEIRGAGNILGPEQHGFLTAVGFGMYCRLLEESVRELKGEKPERQRSVTVDIPVDAYLPVSYVTDETSRVRIYKRLAAARTEEDVLEIESELLDRFGDPPQPACALLKVARIRVQADQLGIASVCLRKDRLVFTIDEPSKFPVEDLGQLARAYRSSLTVTSGDKGGSIGLRLRSSSVDDALKAAHKFLGQLLRRSAQAPSE